MTIDKIIKDGTLQYIITEVAKISTLSLSQIDKYEYLTCQERLAPD